jgi:hypothetical protein
MDIIGLRLECKNCGCSLSIGNAEKELVVDDLLSKSVTFSRCPTCQHPWSRSEPQGWGDTELKAFFRTLRELRSLEKTYGCAIKLEISNSEKV